MEVVLKAGHTASAGNIGVTAFAADIFAYFVYDKNVDVIEFHSGKSSLGYLKKFMVAFNDFVLGECLYFRNFVVCILYHTDSHDNVHIL